MRKLSTAPKKQNAVHTQETKVRSLTNTITGACDHCVRYYVKQYEKFRKSHSKYVSDW